MSQWPPEDPLLPPWSRLSTSRFDSGTVDGCIEAIRIELCELEAIADDLEEIGDRFGENARFRAPGIYSKAARSYDCMVAIRGSLDGLVKAIEEERRGGAD